MTLSPGRAVEELEIRRNPSPRLTETSPVIDPTVAADTIEPQVTLHMKITTATTFPRVHRIDSKAPH
jgi:hypothetical protein